MKVRIAIAASFLILSCISAYGVTLDKVTVLNDHKRPVNYVAFSLDGKKMASSSDDSMVYIWDTVHWQHIGTVRGEEEAIAMAFTRDNSKVFVADRDSKIGCWEADSGARKSYGKIGCAANDMKISPDGRNLAIACDRKKIIIWNVAEDRMENKLEGPKNDVMAIAYNADGTKLISGGKDCQAIVWDTSDWKQLQVVKTHDEDILGLAFSPDAQQAVTGTNDNKVCVWDLKSGQQKAMFAKKEQEGERAVAWHPSGKFLFTVQRIPAVKPAVTDVCQVVAIEPANGQVLASSPVACDVNHLGISPDGGTLAVASREITIFSVREEGPAPAVLHMLPPVANP
jgi:tricorn protease-like protein